MNWRWVYYSGTSPPTGIDTLRRKLHGPGSPEQFVSEPSNDDDMDGSHDRTQLVFSANRDDRAQVDIWPMAAAPRARKTRR